VAEHRFDGRVAVITGGARGLGRSYAELLASKGARVVINDTGSAVRGEGVDTGPAEELATAIKAAGGEAVTCIESVATPQGGKAIVEAAMDHYGQIDIVIHSAGNVRYGLLDEIPQEDFDAVVDVHLMGAFHVVRPAFAYMTKAKYGRIVLTSSIGGFYGNRNTVNYGVSKAGMIGLNNVAAIEGADRNVKSNLILPSAVTRMADGLDTSQYPPLGPELVAPLVGWLVHESCSVSGEALVAIGGRMAKMVIAETIGVYRPSWTIEDIANEMEAIGDTDQLWMFPATTGYREHLGRSFEMVKRGAAALQSE
jgi:NAD(P)-dependent dehydrogenase (short-subunit alcohol dehydrogenase family)